MSTKECMAPEQHKSATFFRYASVLQPAWKRFLGKEDQHTNSFKLYAFGSSCTAPGTDLLWFVQASLPAIGFWDLFWSSKNSCIYDMYFMMSMIIFVWVFSSECTNVWYSAFDFLCFVFRTAHVLEWANNHGGRIFIQDIQRSATDFSEWGGTNHDLHGALQACNKSSQLFFFSMRKHRGVLSDHKDWWHSNVNWVFWVGNRRLGACFFISILSQYRCFLFSKFLIHTTNSTSKFSANTRRIVRGCHTSHILSWRAIPKHDLGTEPTRFPSMSVLCVLCVLCVMDLFSAIGGPPSWRYITACVSQAWPSMTLVNRLPGPHATANSNSMTNKTVNVFRGSQESEDAAGTSAQLHIK